MRVARGAAVAALFAPLALSGLSAQQPRWEVDLTGARIAYDTLPALDAPSLSGRLEWRTPRLFGRLAASVTGFEDAGWSAQLRGDLAHWFEPLAGGPLRLELAAGGSASRHSSGFEVGAARADARLHLVGARGGAWIGAGLARARSSYDTASVGGLVPGVGLWAREGPLRATIGYVHTRVDGLSYPELNLALSLTSGALDLTAYAGLRHSGVEDVPGERWAGVAAAVWVHPHAALVVSGGGYASDVLQGLPGGDYLSIGVRFTPRRARPIPASAAAPIVYSATEARAGEIGFDVGDARTVEIAGDWNGWVPEPLAQDRSGRWLLPAGLAPGVYRFNLRVDGVRWVVPEGVPAMDDGFGGRVGLLIIAEPK